MKILYITNGVHGSGGLERVLAVKASFLAEQYHYEVTILTLNAENRLTFYDFSPKVRFIDVKVYGNVLGYIKLYRKGINRAINIVHPDLISVCDDGLKGLLFPLIFGVKVPIIYERHVSKQVEKLDSMPGLNKRLRNQIVFSLMNIGAARFDRFVVLTNSNLREWNLKNIMVIPNPLPFIPEQKSSLSSKIVLAVGKQSFQKGYDRLLQAWVEVHKTHPDWKLEIYGNQNPALDLEELAIKLGIHDSVTFFPPERNIEEKYLKSSIYVMSSRFEGFGMVLIEAMSHGVPCVSFDCPHGPADIIDHGGDGFLINDGDINAFAKAIIKLIDSKQLRRQMGILAADNVQSYLPKTILHKWDELFKSLVK